MSGYRETLYTNYADSFKNATGAFDSAGADRWAPCFEYYLRNWLPAHKGSSIIDLGCGDGRIIYLLQKLGYTNLCGVDISESQVNIARQISDNIVQTDVLKYLDETMDNYDAILAFDLIEHLHKDEALAFLDNCFKHLAPGGRLILQTPNASSPFFGDVRYGDFTHELCFTPKLLNQLCTRCGFKNVKVREIPPVPKGYSWKSSIRYLFWQVIRMLLLLFNSVETGNTGRGVYTRVFLLSAVKSND